MEGAGGQVPGEEEAGIAREEWCGSGGFAAAEAQEILEHEVQTDAIPHGVVPAKEEFRAAWTAEREERAEGAVEAPGGGQEFVFEGSDGVADCFDLEVTEGEGRGARNEAKSFACPRKSCL